MIAVIAVFRAGFRRGDADAASAADKGFLGIIISYDSTSGHYILHVLIIRNGVFKESPSPLWPDSHRRHQELSLNP
jgi:hypothetical protein